MILQRKTQIISDALRDMLQFPNDDFQVSREDDKLLALSDKSFLLLWVKIGCRPVESETTVFYDDLYFCSCVNIYA